MKRGVLPSQMIYEMIQAKQILNATEKSINPASLDLSISDEIYRIEGVFQIGVTEKISEFINNISVYEWDTKYPLERDVVYIARLNEKMALSESVYGHCNPKSSTGRNDVHVRILADKMPRYDTIPYGYNGDLWTIIQPRSFPIIATVGEFLSQVRFFNQNSRLDETELQIAFDRYKLLWHKDVSLSYEDIKIRDNDGSIILTLDLSGGISGWQCCGLSKILDFSLVKCYEPMSFFTPVNLNGKYLHLKKGLFYILSTKEALRVPPELACEIVPVDERTGDFRSHYAGYFDPGWGYGIDGNGKGRRATLEVRPFEDLIVRDGQPIAKVVLEKMISSPDEHYDQKSTSHYKDQKSPRLSKHFKKEEDF